MNYQATEAASKSNGDGGVCSFLECWDSQKGLQTLHQVYDPMGAQGGQLWVSHPREWADELLAGPGPCWGGWGGGGVACFPGG